MQQTTASPKALADRQPSERASASFAIKAGTTISTTRNTYRVTQPLGLPGATAVVFHVVDSQDRAYALKCSKPDLDHALKSTFLTEIQTLRHFEQVETRRRSRHIPRVIDEGTLAYPAKPGEAATPLPFFVMTLAPGMALDDTLTQRRLKPFDEREVLRIGRQLADVLEMLHGDLQASYSDMKLGNLFWHEGHLTVIDWNVLNKKDLEQGNREDFLRMGNYLHQLLTGVPLPICRTNDGRRQLENQAYLEAAPFRNLTVGTQGIVTALVVGNPDQPPRDTHPGEIQSRIDRHLERLDLAMTDPERLMIQARRDKAHKQLHDAHLALDVLSKRQHPELFSSAQQLEVIQALQDVRDELSRNQRTHFASAMSRLRTGHTRKAMEDFKLALAEEPENTEVRLYAVATQNNVLHSSKLTAPFEDFIKSIIDATLDGDFDTASMHIQNLPAEALPVFRPLQREIEFLNVQGRVQSHIAENQLTQALDALSAFPVETHQENPNLDHLPPLEEKRNDLQARLNRLVRCWENGTKALSRGHWQEASEHFAKTLRDDDFHAHAKACLAQSVLGCYLERKSREDRYDEIHEHLQRGLVQEPVKRMFETRTAEHLRARLAMMIEANQPLSDLEAAWHQLTCYPEHRPEHAEKNAALSRRLAQLAEREAEACIECLRAHPTSDAFQQNDEALSRLPFLEGNKLESFRTTLRDWAQAIERTYIELSHRPLWQRAETLQELLKRPVFDHWVYEGETSAAIRARLDALLAREREAIRKARSAFRQHPDIGEHTCADALADIDAKGWAALEEGAAWQEELFQVKEALHFLAHPPEMLSLDQLEAAKTHRALLSKATVNPLSDAHNASVANLEWTFLDHYFQKERPDDFLERTTQKLEAYLEIGEVIESDAAKARLQERTRALRQVIDFNTAIEKASRAQVKPNQSALKKEILQRTQRQDLISQLCDTVWIDPRTETLESSLKHRFKSSWNAIYYRTSAKIRQLHAETINRTLGEFENLIQENEAPARQFQSDCEAQYEYYLLLKALAPHLENLEHDRSDLAAVLSIDWLADYLAGHHLQVRNRDGTPKSIASLLSELQARSLDRPVLQWFFEYLKWEQSYVEALMQTDEDPETVLRTIERFGYDQRAQCLRDRCDLAIAVHKLVDDHGYRSESDSPVRYHRLQQLREDLERERERIRKSQGPPSLLAKVERRIQELQEERRNTLDKWASHLTMRKQNVFEALSQDPLSVPCEEVAQLKTDIEELNGLASERATSLMAGLPKLSKLADRSTKDLQRKVNRIQYLVMQDYLETGKVRPYLEIEMTYSGIEPNATQSYLEKAKRAYQELQDACRRETNPLNSLLTIQRTHGDFPELHQKLFIEHLREKIKKNKLNLQNLFLSCAADPKGYKLRCLAEALKSECRSELRSRTPTAFTRTIISSLEHCLNQANDHGLHILFNIHATVTRLVEFGFHYPKEKVSSTDRK
ncbi:hypothetical protein [Sulfidibacter corallicola]|uniref:Protein kinase domain-containing protein n=1 Tax=Sulfidibacter corallicola TaxID=2818388 RepID=A0A8A4TQH7_SULCO|nr:hypothetical protein [Sulfidibacter corallicola]QTD51793.1 hypothetical protein J3U87_04925 [Sulfidibacter corallicola]